MDLEKRPKHLPQVQALAAIGQCRLMSLWDQLFGHINHPIAQILLTRNDIADRTQYQNAQNTFLELRTHAARRLWRSLNGRAPGPDFRAVPAQLRQWYTLSLRALDARLHGESYRTIAEVLLGFRGSKEDFEGDPRKNKARRLVAHGIKMMRGGYRLLLHYPIKPSKR